MGANLIMLEFDGDLNVEDVRAKFMDLRRGDEEFYGKDPYSGSLATFSGISIQSGIFQSRAAAEAWIMEKSEKWGPAYAVRGIEERGGRKKGEKYKDPKTGEMKTALRSTKGKPVSIWYVGGWAAE